MKENESGLMDRIVKRTQKQLLVSALALTVSGYGGILYKTLDPEGFRKNISERVEEYFPISNAWYDEERRKRVKDSLIDLSGLSISVIALYAGARYLSSSSSRKRKDEYNPSSEKREVA